jgi:MarR family transcriptional regulator, organic hydroperoxide resistance regulator
MCNLSSFFSAICQFPIIFYLIQIDRSIIYLNFSRKTLKIYILDNLLGGNLVQKLLDSVIIAQLEKDLRKISTIIKQKGREILTNYPITTPQFIALQWLLEEGDLTIGELSKKLHLAFSTTTDLVDRLEKNELVKRVRDPKDRRVVQIHLLEKGKIIIDEVIEKRQQYLQEVLQSFDDKQVQSLSVVLEQLLSEMLLHQENNTKSK